MMDLWILEKVGREFWKWVAKGGGGGLQRIVGVNPRNKLSPNVPRLKVSRRQASKASRTEALVLAFVRVQISKISQSS